MKIATLKSGITTSLTLPQKQMFGQAEDAEGAVLFWAKLDFQEKENVMLSAAQRSRSISTTEVIQSSGLVTR
ncbi:hypothetical protein MUN81_21185 [Hymenobacter sp. 5317J-9]|uniref:hypothetical protein n=1 Tax=Hymenobacter sp. 5317J-9 TaxID=2932250 RepID=UPI001FD72167|nr:hypothetical protein [Hymenobacter sp. 5317J-9]UOQ97730.1 hypothetical protein MUN81_21185 [Hymenobacter sp. 5317J-9]